MEKEFIFGLMADKSYLTIEEVAARFGINPSTVYRLAQAGKIPAFKIGSQWRFSKELLDEWVRNRVANEK